jgi:hypothetical protein
MLCIEQVVHDLRALHHRLVCARQFQFTISSIILPSSVV